MTSRLHLFSHWLRSENHMNRQWYGAVAKDGSHIRSAMPADDKGQAEALLMEAWTDRLKALYEIKPVQVTVLSDEAQT